jgi:hypothetical protein
MRCVSGFSRVREARSVREEDDGCIMGTSIGNEGNFERAENPDNGCDV